MTLFQKALVTLALGVGSLFVGLGSAEAQRIYRGYGGGYYGGYAPRYYVAPNYGYPPNYGYRPYYGRPYYRNYGVRPYGYYGGSGVYIGRGGIGIRF